jgi:uncharacterized protein (DUF3084 family)
MQNKGGKTLTIFIVLVTILLVSSTAIGFFMYQKESQMRKDLEIQLEEAGKQQKKLSDDLKDAKNQLTLLQDKNREADKKINNLMDEMELNEGLRNELKKENGSLKDYLEAAKKEKDSVRTDMDNAAKKLQETQELLKAEQEKTKDLLAKVNVLVDEKKQAEAKVAAASSNNQLMPGVDAPKNKMELDKIVVGQDSGNKGRVLTVDKDSDFVICSIGIKQGFKAGDILSVYRGDKYLGDVKISRVQEEMSAADFISPLSSRQVHKNDIVVLKQS